MQRTLFHNLKRLTKRQYHKEDLTPLAKLLKTEIKLKGPISIYDYFKQCLLHPLHGYYMHKDVFGKKGDFITSPEISQMFGEMLGIYFVYYYQFLNSKKKIQLVELGPGRGTLMVDMLNTIKQFPFLYDAIENVYMVEQSPYLTSVQQFKLKPFQLSKKWVRDLEEVPDQYTFLVAHEFYDALPVYQFIKKDEVMKELVVDIDETDSPFHFQLGISKRQPPFEVPSSLEEGEVVQTSPDVVQTTMGISRLLKNGGCGLVIDYGYSNIRQDRIRGIHNHQFVSCFSKPGLVDLSTDVDFQLLKTLFDKQELKSYLLNQGEFLNRMGISARLLTLLSNCSSKEEREMLVKGYERLVKGEMAGIYKVLSVNGDGVERYPFSNE